MTKLSVNVNKIATLRNSRGGDVPNVLAVARDILRFGAQGITVHPRPDGRHIRFDDVHALALMVADLNQKNPDANIEFNVEGYPDAAYLKLLSQVEFHQATLVPDPPDVLTSNAGWKLQQHQEFLIGVTQQIKQRPGARVSLFVDAFKWTPAEKSALMEIKADRIELYTEAFAKSFNTPEIDSILNVYRLTAADALAVGYGVNAGHDLDHLNIARLLKAIPEIDEVSIGHALISQSLYWGLEKTIGAYLQAMKGH